MRTVSLACVTAAVIGLGAVQASAALSQGDQTFVDKSATGGLAEVQTAQLAQQRAASPQVKQFASKMITDHTQANGELQQIAEQKKLTLPSQPGREHVATEQKLRGLNGSAFDQAYAQEEVRDHQEDVALFQREASSGQDPDLKAFAQKTLPTLQRHLQMAQGLTSSR
jgi:putative membrane protein